MEGDRHCPRLPFQQARVCHQTRCSSLATTLRHSSEAGIRRRHHQPLTWLTSLRWCSPSCPELGSSAPAAAHAGSSRGEDPELVVDDVGRVPPSKVTARRRMKGWHLRLFSHSLHGPKRRWNQAPAWDKTYLPAPYQGSATIKSGRRHTIFSTTP